jgi:hypothetical protein
MKLKLPNDLTQSEYSLARQCGYLPIKDRISEKKSYIRKLSQQRYPRFHLYIYPFSEKETVFDLHLDQNVNRYEGQKAHNADYESAEVKEELLRIYKIAKQFINKA